MSPSKILEERAKMSLLSSSTLLTTRTRNRNDPPRFFILSIEIDAKRKRNVISRGNREEQMRRLDRAKL